MYNDTLQMTILFDFFGDLLTSKQREYFDLYHNEDLSLSEIAERAGISRQGVYDMIARAEKTLIDIEQKTGVVKRWRESRDVLRRAGEMAKELQLLCCDGEAASLATELVLTIESCKD